MADLISQAKVPLLPLNSRPQYMLLRYTPTCMLHVCSASDRISCNFDSMTEIMAERSCCVNLNVQIRFLHASTFMI